MQGYRISSVRYKKYLLGSLLLLGLQLMQITSVVQAQSTKEVKTAGRPNIIFLLADDLGFGDVGFNGQTKIRTPYMDQLAAEGMQFEQFYAGTSVCAPSRACLLTGMHSGHTYIRGNKSTPPEGQEPMPNTGRSLAQYLQRAGYQTAAFGKWGLGFIGTSGSPDKQGFDDFYGYNSQSLAHRYYPDHLWDNDQKIVLTGNDKFLNQSAYAPDLIQQRALDFLDHSSEKKPFFLFLPYILPHAELVVPDDSIFASYKGKFPEAPYKGLDYGPGASNHGYASQAYPHAAFAAMVTRLDLYLGQLMAKLKEKGLDKNTLIIFTSDNGPHIEGGADPAFFQSSGIYRGVKRDLYEGGIREPFVAWWPGVIKPGTKSNHIGAFWDFLPTFMELAGSSAPKDIDGLSFVPSLTGKGTQQNHPYLYWELHEDGGKQALREGDWKAVRLDADKTQNAPIQLYNLKLDPSEKEDVAADHPDIVTRFRKLMAEAHHPSVLFPFGYEVK